MVIFMMFMCAIFYVFRTLKQIWWRAHRSCSCLASSSRMEPLVLVVSRPPKFLFSKGGKGFCFAGFLLDGKRPPKCMHVFV
jgi:hypothetical protein